MTTMVVLNVGIDKHANLSKQGLIIMATTSVIFDLTSLSSLSAWAPTTQASTSGAQRTWS